MMRRKATIRNMKVSFFKMLFIGKVVMKVMAMMMIIATRMMMMTMMRTRRGRRTRRTRRTMMSVMKILLMIVTPSRLPGELEGGERNLNKC